MVLGRTGDACESAIPHLLLTCQFTQNTTTVYFAWFHSHMSAQSNECRRSRHKKQKERDKGFSQSPTVQTHRERSVHPCFGFSFSDPTCQQCKVKKQDALPCLGVGCVRVAINHSQVTLKTDLTFQNDTIPSPTFALHD